MGVKEIFGLYSLGCTLEIVLLHSLDCTLEVYTLGVYTLSHRFWVS